ncbi:MULTISPECIES: hypothetical protein [Streptomycetaceae]|uniref:Integral membrane protein n=1 Tax=Streptantibioticus cattleyicolor (strain ATCC 35852 / DSM 46488 / JCM 4925 / NBRC 14057 / NRRL 8057) TaxID=1003195 RepID=F8JZW8_STREN|nr:MULTISPECIES: hypothetical protein [Streptomycetaceae]AEW93555.1 hypothetical protein SCATT_11840 [Streptantibioticus cattleyicolor NRRL 8057 = DSM 46488]MYS58261.1 hypothetical protein [Streptomyces sp. SID5468]CCB73904.1 putative membrane protein [Streptantibioticus cattleyicolor NRRL 8057 = DSM 46488]
MEGTAQLRTARAALFAGLCVTLSSTSHVLLSRVPLPLTMVALVFAAVFLTAYALAGRERGFWAISGLLVPLELAADTVFTTGQHACYGPAGGPVTGPLRTFGADLVCDGGAVGTPLTAAGPVVADPVVPWLLLAAHAAVGLAASWWLRRGEAAVQQLLRATAAFAFRPLLRVGAVLGARLPVAPRVPRPAVRAAAAPRPLLLTHSVVRRGPPCPAASA